MSRSCIYEIITPELLQATVLAGVDLTLADGSPFSDAMWDQSISQGISWAETSLDVHFQERKVKKERHDHIMEHDWTQQFLDRRPVQRVDALTGNYGTLVPVRYPIEWVQLTSALHGHFTIVPTTPEALATGLHYAVFLGPLSGVPNWYHVDYTAGFPCLSATVTLSEGETELVWEFPQELHSDFTPEVFSITYTDPDQEGSIVTSEISNGAVTFATATGAAVEDVEFRFLIHTFPKLVIDLILRRAAQVALATAGDLILGAGIAGFSRSMDGLIEAVQSTSSPTNSGYGARLLQFEREATQMEGMLRAQFRGMNLFAF